MIKDTWVHFPAVLWASLLSCFGCLWGKNTLGLSFTIYHSEIQLHPKKKRKEKNKAKQSKTKQSNAKQKKTKPLEHLTKEKISEVSPEHLNLETI